MKTKLLMIGLLFAGNALAFHCPADMKSIDDALAKGPALSADDHNHLSWKLADQTIQ